MSTTRKRSRVMGTPVVLVNLRRSSSVPNVEFCEGTLVRSLTMLGGSVIGKQLSNLLVFRVASPSRTIGDVSFCGPGAPSRWPAPALVPLVSRKMKSAALLLLSKGAFVITGPVAITRASVLQLPLLDPVQPPAGRRVNE